jgi:ubiquinone/menaquinone biosynthesis C-methylase UbiE
MNTFKDLFSIQAKDYAKYRPTYPPELFQFLSTLSKKKNKVWDVGTGNGQAAVELSKYFTEVVATDPSEKQIREADQRPNITYKIESAEAASFRDVDLITVAQAFHWFKHAEFAETCKRVSARAVEKLYNGLLGPYWEKERKLVESGYSTIDMPFQEISPPKINMSIEWTYEQFSGYLKTWSALQTYLKSNSPEKVEACFEEIKSAWNSSDKLKITWPLNMRIWAINLG